VKATRLLAIKLPNGRETLIDFPFAFLCQHAWYVSNSGYVVRSLSGQSVALHREIMGLVHGRELSKDEVVDHINHDTLDNRTCNLRTASRSENQYNRIPIRETKSGFKGVSFHRSSEKWQAMIGLGGKTHHLGIFHNIHEAAASYDQAAIKHYGRFAKTNFPLSAYPEASS
jgi:hypothetical protein